MISAAAQYDERVPQHVDCTSDRYMNFEILVQILADTDARGGIAAEAKNVPTWRLLKVSPYGVKKNAAGSSHGRLQHGFKTPGASTRVAAFGGPNGMQRGHRRSP